MNQGSWSKHTNNESPAQPQCTPEVQAGEEGFALFQAANRKAHSANRRKLFQAKTLRASQLSQEASLMRGDFVVPLDTRRRTSDTMSVTLKPTAAAVHGVIRLLIDNLVNIKDETGKFLLYLEDGRVIDTKSWAGWEWTHGIGLYGVWKYYEMTGHESLLKIIEDWFAARFAEGGTTKNINTMAVFLTLAYVYEKTSNVAYLPWLDSWAEWAMYELPRTKYGGMQHITYNSINSEQLWDDTLMMTVLPLAKIGKLLGRPEYVAEAKKQFLLHIKYLFDPRIGLFFHGWEFKGENGGHNFAQALWARGNSWLTIVIPEILELLDFDLNDPIRLHLIHTLDAQCGALKQFQHSSGYWRTLIDQADEGSYVEASATAGFAYGMLKGQRKRYIGSEYRETAEKAIQAVLSSIDSHGELQNTSFGTAMGHNLDFYREIPITSMPYGQAMAIMALVEYLRTYI